MTLTIPLFPGVLAAAWPAAWQSRRPASLHLMILKKTEFYKFNLTSKNFDMQKLSYDEKIVLNQKDEVISFKCELQENLQKAMKEFVEKHPNWDQYRILQAAIAGFLIEKGFQNRDLTRLYIGNMFSMNFKE